MVVQSGNQNRLSAVIREKQGKVASGSPNAPMHSILSMILLSSEEEIVCLRNSHTSSHNIWYSSLVRIDILVGTRQSRFIKDSVDFKLRGTDRSLCYCRSWSMILCIFQSLTLLSTTWRPLTSRWRKKMMQQSPVVMAWLSRGWKRGKRDGSINIPSHSGCVRYWCV